MKVRFLQSSDPEVYIKLFAITSRTVIEYCARQGFEFDGFVGLKRGAKPWHAALNRIVMLKSYLDAGYDGWVIYLDADAFVADLDFNLSGYLADKGSYGMIASPSGVQPPSWWDINNGVFAINFAHEAGRAIVSKWAQELATIPEESLVVEAHWSDVVDDQALLHTVFHNNGSLEPYLFRDEGKVRIFNWDARFIKQFIRVSGNFETRRERLRRAVAVTLDANPREVIAGETEVRREIVRAIYRVCLGREADEIGFNNALANLTSGSRTVEDELRACMCSEEFKKQFIRFVREVVKM